jgi:hypothetical protein
MSETVFIVEGTPDYEISDELVVFRTRERAEEFIQQQPERDGYKWYISKCEIED